MSSSHSELHRLKLPFDSESVDSMLTLLKLSKLPDKAPIPTTDKWGLGIDLDYLATLKRTFESAWSWKKLEQRMKLDDNFTVEMKEGRDELTVHFIHCRSPKANAIPLLLLHGWPGDLRA